MRAGDCAPALGALLIAAAIAAAGHAWAQATPPQARVSPTQKSFRATDRVGVEVDTHVLRDGSNFRLIVVPANAPDAVPSANDFALASTAIRNGLQRLTLPPGPPGASEVRLYYIPNDASRFAVGGRAAVEIGARTPNTTLSHDLTSEAKALGPVRFEAKYRDQPFVLEGAYLRVETRTAGATWEAIIARTYQGPRNYMAIYVGHLGAEKRSDAPTEVLCLMDAENKKNVDRAAGLNPGDFVLLHGHATAWGRVYESQVVIFDRCAFAK